MKNKPLVFLGSSTEGLKVLDLVVKHLEEECQPVRWKEAFLPSQGYLETLIAKAEEVDFGIFILTPDDLLVSRLNNSPVPRDNLLFESGLFMGKIGKDRTFLIHDRSIKLPSRLNASNYIFDFSKDLKKKILVPGCSFSEFFEAYSLGFML